MKWSMTISPLIQFFTGIRQLIPRVVKKEKFPSRQSPALILIHSALFMVAVFGLFGMMTKEASAQMVPVTGTVDVKGKVEVRGQVSPDFEAVSDMVGVDCKTTQFFFFLCKGAKLNPGDIVTITENPVIVEPKLGGKFVFQRPAGDPIRWVTPDTISDPPDPILDTPKELRSNISHVQGLKRFGATDPLFGYPLWYEDFDGIRLGLCDHPNNCFLELPDMAAPMNFETNMGDETFFWAGEALMFGTNAKNRALLVQAIEGAFFNEEIIKGDNVVFARIRFYIDNLVGGNQYRITAPYLVTTIIAPEDGGPGVVKGPGFSMTQDVGITGPSEFTGVLKGSVGPFLIPLSYTPGDAFLTDGLAEGPVTGSPIGKNFFRIEGANIGDGYDELEYWCTDAALGPYPDKRNDCIQTVKFTVMGKIADKFGAQIDEANITRTSTETYVNVWANSVEGQRLLVSVDGGPASNMTEGAFGTYFARVATGTGTRPLKVRVQNIGDNPASLSEGGIKDVITFTDASYTIGGALHIAVQNSNTHDTPPMWAYVWSGQQEEISFPLIPSPLSDGTAEATFSDFPLPPPPPPGELIPPGEFPPLMVRVESDDGGFSNTGVQISGGVTSGDLVSIITANAGPDHFSNRPGVGIVLNGDESIGLGNLTYTWTYTSDQPITLTINNANQATANFLTPASIPGGKVVVTFTLTVTDGPLTSSDTAIVTMIQQNALPTDGCRITAADYRNRREKWIVEGVCDIVGDPPVMVQIFLGSVNGPDRTLLIGDAVVVLERIGHVGPLTPLFTVAPGNRSAVAMGTVPISNVDPIKQKRGQGGVNPDIPRVRVPEPIPAHAKVWLETDRGTLVSFDYNIR